MIENKSSPPAKILWAYAYDIAPPQAEDGCLVGIQALLDQEHSDAVGGARTWAGRVVIEEKTTHILIVSDSPNQDREVNRRLEGELKKLRAGFAITLPMAVGDNATSPPQTGPTN